jgi:hypothetical protein
MKRLTFLILLTLAIVSMPAAARADTVKLYDWTAAGNFAANGGNGGPFRAETSGPLLGTSSFVTFCIEYNEYFTYGTEYEFVLSDAAKNGGVSGGYPEDPVSNATKWLYYQAVTGGYSSWYTTAVPGASLADTDIGANFQYAIWSLEGEMSLTAGSAGALVAAYASGHENWAALAAQGHHVYAMNLTSRNAAGAVINVQDQLAYTAPVPDGGATLTLLAGALVGVGALRKRRG